MLQATLRPKVSIVSKKLIIITFSHTKAYVTKMGQGQPRVIIRTTLVVVPYTMLHTKFQGHWSIGSGDDFLRFLPYMGVAAMLVL